MRAVAPWFAGLGILLFSANLRAPIVGVSPLVQMIRDDTGYSAATAGLLTTIPVLCFGLASPLAAWLGRRFGIERTVFAALIALFAGILLRAIPDTLALFAGTVVVGIAITLGNVLLPGLIKRDFPHRVGLMTGLYSMTLSAGSALVAASVVPLAQATGWGWREVLALTAFPVAATVLVWLPQLRLRHLAPSGSGIGGMLRSPVAWAVTLFMGLQSINYFGLTAWIPAIFSAVGFSASEAGLLLGAASVAGIAGSLVAPILATRSRSQVGISLVAGAAVAMGMAGLLVAPAAGAIAWAILLGLGQGMALSIALLLIVLRTSSAESAADLSGMSQSFGYLVGATGPVVVGALHDASGSWSLPLLVLMALLGAQLIAGALAARDRQVFLDADAPRAPAH